MAIGDADVFDFNPLPAYCYPFTIEHYSLITGELLCTVTVTGPDQPVELPDLPPDKHPFHAIFRYADGENMLVLPNGYIHQFRGDEPPPILLATPIRTTRTT